MALIDYFVFLLFISLDASSHKTSLLVTISNDSKVSQVILSASLFIKILLVKSNLPKYKEQKVSLGFYVMVYFYGFCTWLSDIFEAFNKVRVWDTTTSSAVRSSCCVGMTSTHGAPVNMKCHDSLLYVAAGSSVVAIDLRTMQKAITAAICQSKLYSFEAMPSKSLICTGSNDRLEFKISIPIYSFCLCVIQLIPLTFCTIFDKINLR